LNKNAQKNGQPAKKIQNVPLLFKIVMINVELKFLAGIYVSQQKVVKLQFKLPNVPKLKVVIKKKKSSMKFKFSKTLKTVLINIVRMLNKCVLMIEDAFES